MRRPLASLCLTLAFATVLAACGKDAPANRNADDPARARRLVLVAADFPAGWTGTQPTEDPSEDEESKKLAACAGAVDPTVSTSAEFEGQDFSNGDAKVSSEVTVVKTREQAQTDLAAITGTKFPQCAKDQATDTLQRELAGSGATLASVAFDPLSTPKIGDATAAYRLVATVASGSRQLKVYLDLFFILKFRAEISLAFTDVGKPFDEGLRQQLLDKMSAKVNATS